MIVPGGEFRIMFVSKEYQKATAFYGDVLQLPVDHAWDFGPSDCGTIYVAGGGMIEVLGGLAGVEYAPPQGAWVALQVKDVDALYAHLKEHGVTILEEPKNYPWGHRILKAQDPDGLVLWFSAPVAD